MRSVTLEDIRKIYIPPADSHKGQNGKLLIIGGSHLFHAASLWALTVASRIVDLVHYSSVPENNELVAKIKGQFRDGIVVPRSEVEAYVREDDCILIGPGMTRDGETSSLTNDLLKKYTDKQWVIDAGALQMMDVSRIPRNAILTPHSKEFEDLLKRAEVFRHGGEIPRTEENVQTLARRYNCTVLLKGSTDIVCNRKECVQIEGGNAGMTKGGTGDVLAGLIAALACKNDPWLATIAGSYINKKAGDELHKTVGPYFNASDLANAIPRIMKQLFI